MPWVHHYISCEISFLRSSVACRHPCAADWLWKPSELFSNLLFQYSSPYLPSITWLHCLVRLYAVFTNNAQNTRNNCLFENAEYWKIFWTSALPAFLSIVFWKSGMVLPCERLAVGSNRLRLMDPAVPLVLKARLLLTQTGLGPLRSPNVLWHPVTRIWFSLGGVTCLPVP